MISVSEIVLLISQNQYMFIAGIIAFIVLSVASLMDIKTHEVLDMLNYGLFFTAIVFRLLWAVFEWNAYVLLDGFAGFIIGFGIGMLMFYTGQWGGGDSKMIIGLGVLFGFPLSSLLSTVSLYDAMNSFFVSFIINMFIAGAFLGMIWMLVLAYINRKQFCKSWKKIYAQSKIYRYIASVVFIIFIAFGFFIGDVIIFSLLGCMLFLTYFVYVFAKSVERGCMIKIVPPSEVTEGDWIDKDVKHNGKIITGPKDLGITKKQIAQLKQYKIKKVPVKVGIPFIPSFFVGFIATVLIGNSIIYLLMIIL